MKTKKLLALVCAGMMALSLAACGGGSAPAPAPSNDGAAPADSGAAAPAAAQNITLVLSQRDEWLSTLVDGATAAAAEMGVTLTTVDCQSDASKGIQFVETAKNAGEQVVIVNLVDPAQAQQIIESAGDMKIVFVNRTPDDMARLNDNVVYVGSNEMDSGRYQGEALAKYFKDKGQTEIKYILLNGILGQTSTTNRTLSVLQTLEANGITATEATAPLVANYERPKAMDMIKPLLGTTEYDCIISNNDAMALGAIEALESANMDPSEKPIVGIDCTADGAAAVAAGKMYMTVFQNADGQGRGALQAAMNLVNGAPLNEGTEFEVDAENPHILWVPFEPVDASNVADYQ
ncbi:MAG: substrate-binding domain-containing protein [Oscillibacter sp.]|nr:substrate-binding domain-containing protein [Oscillibacter sp.]